MNKLLTAMLIASMAIEGALFVRGMEHQREWHEEQMRAIQHQQDVGMEAYKALHADVMAIRADAERKAEASEPSRGVRRVMTVEATAYTSSADECGKADGITASGAKAIPGYTVAADDLPLGARLLINGKVYAVQDRFGGGYTNRIDINMASKDECFAFGRREIQVEVLE